MRPLPARKYTLKWVAGKSSYPQSDRSFAAWLKADCCLLSQRLRHIGPVRGDAGDQPAQSRENQRDRQHD